MGGDDLQRVEMLLSHDSKQADRSFWFAFFDSGLSDETKRNETKRNETQERIQRGRGGEKQTQDEITGSVRNGNNEGNLSEYFLIDENVCHSRAVAIHAKGDQIDEIVDLLSRFFRHCDFDGRENRGEGI